MKEHTSCVYKGSFIEDFSCDSYLQSNVKLCNKEQGLLITCSVTGGDTQ